MIYYENATLELFGCPIAYMPYFWTPDPTVKRKTGFLAPHYIASSSLGTGVSIPFFWDVAPNYDLTLQPTFLTPPGRSRPGRMAPSPARPAPTTSALAGIFQRDDSGVPAAAARRPETATSAARSSPPGASTSTRNGAGAGTSRCSRTSGSWPTTASRARASRRSTSRSRSRRSTCRARATAPGSTRAATTSEACRATTGRSSCPSCTRSSTTTSASTARARSAARSTFKLNLTSLTREATHFSQIPNINFGLFNQVPAYNGYYETCTVFERGACLVRGFAGPSPGSRPSSPGGATSSTRSGRSGRPSPMSGRTGSGTSSETAGFQNSQIPNFIGGDDDFVGRLMPAVGLEYRYPFVAQSSDCGHARPRADRAGHRPPERDADRPPAERGRPEPRLRRHVPLQLGQVLRLRPRRGRRARQYRRASTRFTGANGFYANALFGQSYQLAGRNSFRPGDLINVGRDSGLESRASDYVTRLLIKPNQNFAFSTRARFDENDFAMHRLETQLYDELGTPSSRSRPR